MALSVSSIPTSERWPRQAVLVAAFGGLLSVVGSALVFAGAYREREREFAAQGRALLAAADEHMAQVASTVAALQGLLASSPNTDGESFEAFCSTIFGRFAHVEALLLFERAADGSERWPLARRHPANARLPIGFDLAELASRGFAERAAATDAQPLALELEVPGGGRRALLALPARQAGADASIVAWSAALVRIDELARDGGEHVGAPWLRVDFLPTPPADGQGEILVQRRLALAPAGWTAVVRVSPDAPSPLTEPGGWASLAVGLALTGLLTHRVRTLELRSRALSHANAELYTEVAERHSVETKLRETQRTLATLVANLPGVAYRCRNSREFEMEFISDAIATLTGRPARDYLDGVVQYGRDVIHPDDREYVWNAVQQAVDAHRPFQLVYRIVTATKQIKWIWEQGRGVYSRADELLALEGLLNDITERKLAEEGLKREMRFVDAIVDSLPGNFYVFEESGRFVRWNANVEEVTGFTPLELAAMSPMDFFAGEDRERVERAVRQVFEEGRTKVDARLIRKAGGSTPFHFTGVLFQHDGVRYLVGVGIDVSERDEALAEQARVRAQLIHTSKLESLGVMASGIAHDFNNLLTVVAASTGLAQSSLDPSNEAHSILQQALDASQHASEITRQMLSLSRGEAAARGPADISAVVRSLEKLLRSSIKKRVRIEYELEEHLPVATADSAQLRQLVLNLALNAGEACQENNGALRISTGAHSYEAADLATPAFRGSKRGGPHVFVEVLDDGVGMDQATLARLGEPFFTTRVAGRGLGLAAVLSILRAHAGWLELDSETGQGTRVRACIPVA
ncbi:MAG: PAS domain-containing protein [Planctomycetes bacterium]|nr:PAS domain-containing protein [Planctomycetota bacterium]